jgi:hypothetical protein
MRLFMPLCLYCAGNTYRDREHKPRAIVFAAGSQFYG